MLLPPVDVCCLKDLWDEAPFVLPIAVYPSSQGLYIPQKVESPSRDNGNGVRLRAVKPSRPRSLGTPSLGGSLRPRRITATPRFRPYDVEYLLARVASNGSGGSPED